MDETTDTQHKEMGGQYVRTGGAVRFICGCDTNFILIWCVSHPIAASGERLAVTLAPVEFNALMQWLTQLERRNRIRTVVFDVVAQGNQPGYVMVNRLVCPGMT